MQNTKKEVEVIETPAKIQSKNKELNEAEEIAIAEKEERNTLPYLPASTCTPVGVSVPTKLAYETIEALSVFTRSGIDTSEFVREKLGYSSRITVCDAFSAEQTDAIALAINQIEKNKGFILGDMAGIGKGRVCAGVLRYAKKVGKIPVFVTFKSSLFSDIYRDINAIGGLDDKDTFPFILNSDSDSTIKRVSKKEDGTEEVEVLHKPLSTNKTVQICKTKKMPENYDLIITTYSQLQGDTESGDSANIKAKYDFLTEISPNCIFIFDESHNAAGSGVGAENWAKLISISGGVMFSSATYAKTPSSMLLYISKTDLSDSNINPETIVNAVKTNGEAIQEYLASALVKAGQMIRRERTFEKCKITYDYIKKDVDKIYTIYDTIVAIYNKIEEFCDSKIYVDAQRKALLRIVEENKISVVPEEDPKPPASSKDFPEWYERNREKYTVRWDTTRGVRNRFAFMESLLFAVKADFVVENVLNALSKKTFINEETGKEEPLMYEYKFGNDIKLMNTNTKPVISVRSTNQAIFENLDYKVGDMIAEEDYDFSRSLITIAKNILKAKCSFTPVEPTEERVKIEIEESRMLDSDFDDNGTSYADLLRSVEMGRSGLPLSPLDYVIEKIQAVQRQSWDYQYNSKDNYSVDEVTGRTMGIRKVEGGYEVYQIKGDSTPNKVARFNSGATDVIILNTSGSTGLSLHSEVNFTDRRPRNMFMHQVQLDVAVEVQMRGRVNRTGQVNNPSYTYLVSCVPAEVRKLLMLRQKLRSLDANTTGNVRQSAKASRVVDRKGIEVEDITNRYGWQVLKDFVNLPGNESLKKLKRDTFWNKDDRPEERVAEFLLRIETLYCTEQERFYDGINEVYSTFKKEKVEAKEWDLETSVEDLNASTRNKKILYMGNDKNQFTKSVYIEDKYVNPRGKPYKNRAEVEKRMITLADGNNNFTKFQNELISDFEKYKKEEREELLLGYGEPKIADIKEAQAKALESAENEEEKAKINAKYEAKIVVEQQIHQQKIDNAILIQDMRFNQVQNRLTKFRIGSYYIIPVDSFRFGLASETGYDKDGKRISMETVPAIFLGFRINKKTPHTYAPFNIELNFATTRRIKPNLQVSCVAINLLNWIDEAKIGLNTTEDEIKELDKWIVVQNLGRENMRILTGEVFKAIELADSLIKDSSAIYNNRKKLIKYTTTAGTVEVGVRMFTNGRAITLDKQITPTYAAIDSPDFMEYVKKRPNYQKMVWLQSLTDFVSWEKDHFELGICTGKGYIRGKFRTNKDYVSKLTKPEVIEMLEKVAQSGKEVTDITTEMYVTGSEKSVRMEFFVLRLNEKTFLYVMEYIYKEFGFKQQIDSAQGEGFIVLNMEDMSKGESKYKKGEYEYYPLTPFEVSSPPANYIEGSFEVSDKNTYGKIKLYYPANTVEASLNQIVPANITESQAVRNILDTMATEKDRKEFEVKVKELSKDVTGDFALDKVVYRDIYSLAMDYILVDPKFAVGNVLPSKVGRIIADNIGKPAPAPEDDKKVEVDTDEVESAPVNYDTVQTFLIKLKSL
jgi:hypothetical protein